MTTVTIDQLEGILKAAPRGATHVGTDGTYYRYRLKNGVAEWDGFSINGNLFADTSIFCMHGLRALDDVRTLLETFEYTMELERRLGIE